MSRMLKTGLIACALAAFAAPIVRAADEDKTPAREESIGWTPVAVGLATPCQIPWGFNWDLFGIDLSLGYSDFNLMYGCELSVGANTSRDDMIGLQAAIGFNLSNRNGYGVQMALFNMENGAFYGANFDAVSISRSFYGWKADLLAGAVEKGMYGLQSSIVGNAAGEEMWGVQVAPGVNFAKVVHGCQIAMGYNQTSELHGAQLGLVNFAATCPFGFQVGLVNIIADNMVPFLPFVNAYF